MIIRQRIKTTHLKKENIELKNWMPYLVYNGFKSPDSVNIKLYQNGVYYKLYFLSGFWGLELRVGDL